MDLLQGKVKNIYFRYLAAAFGSAMITSIYSIVDMAMVGQYQGPTGTAALAVVAPIWNIIYSLGLLTGIGGSVLYSHARGKSTRGEANEFFTVAFIGTVLFAVASWVAIVFFEEPLLMLFGANEALLPLAQDYMMPIRFAIPLFVFNQMFAAFLRNDNRPALATGAVLAGGIFNVVGDYVFVFTCNFGIYGAGLATALGALITFLVMLSHFFSKKNTLCLVLPHRVFWRSKRILTLGFSTFFIDIAMGILTMMFNRQIMQYFGTDALSVYGIIVNISTLVQCCAYSVGQAAQPIISINHGAKQGKRIQETLRYALQTVAIFSLLWTAVILAVPNLFIYIFMAPTASVLAIAPGILRSYGISFLLLPLNIFSTYYFQSIMKAGASFFVSVARGIVISGIMIYMLPQLFGGPALWFAMPITETIVAAFVVFWMVRYTRRLSHIR